MALNLNHAGKAWELKFHTLYYKTMASLNSVLYDTIIIADQVLYRRVFSR